MKSKHPENFGRFSVEIEIANHSDLVWNRISRADPTAARWLKLSAEVDPTTLFMVLPPAIVKQLGLPIKNFKTEVRHANGRCSLRSQAEGAHVRIQGRDNIFSAIVEPRRDTMSIGLMVLDQRRRLRITVIHD